MCVQTLILIFLTLLSFVFQYFSSYHLSILFLLLLLLVYLSSSSSNSFPAGCTL